MPVVPFSQNNVTRIANTGGNWDDPDTARYLREQNIKEDYPNLYNRSKATQPRRPRQEGPSSQLPSETDYLLALAEMHRQGRFSQDSTDVTDKRQQVAGISTRQQSSWQRRLKDAESDEDIIKLRESMKRKGVDPDSYPALQLAPEGGDK